MNHGAAPHLELVEAKLIARAGDGDARLTDTSVLDVGEKAAFAVLGSPLRLRLFEIIRRAGECSVRELSSRSGLSTTGLYYHLRALEHVDLIRQVGVRKGDARRAPAVFSATCARIRVVFCPEDPLHHHRVSAIRRRWHEESLESMEHAPPQTPGTGPMRACLEWESLTQDEIEHIHGLFGKVEAICQRARNRGLSEPSDARPVHLGFHMCETGNSSPPKPQLSIEPQRGSRRGRTFPERDGLLLDRPAPARN